MLFILLISAMIVVSVGIQVYNLLSGRRFVHDLLDAYRIKKLTLKEADNHWQINEKSSIIISLTTIPSRLPYLEFTLKSLLIQTLAPQKIILYLPEFSTRENTRYTIPESLQTLKGLEIVSCVEYGPATKFIPAIQQLASSQRIVVVDDDKIYDRNLIRRFETLSNKNPDCAIASSGWIVPDDLIDKPTNLYRNLFLIPPTPIHGSRIKHQRQVDIIMGCSGFLIRPEFFKLNDLLNRDNAPQSLWYVDDVWISAHCQVKKIVFPAERCCFQYPTLEKLYRATSLGLINRGKGTYLDRHNTVGIRYFKEKWMNHCTTMR